MARATRVDDTLALEGGRGSTRRSGEADVEYGAMGGASKEAMLLHLHQAGDDLALARIQAQRGGDAALARCAHVWPAAHHASGSDRSDTNASAARASCARGEDYDALGVSELGTDTGREVEQVLACCGA